MKVVTSQHMKDIEKASLAYDLTYARLMENAGAAAAAFIRRTFPVKGRNCIVFCGAGNNGGDGFVVARKLSENGANLLVVLVQGPPRSEEARNMLTMAEIMELPILTMEKHQAKIMECLPHTDIIVDAVYGTGFHGELEGMPALACSMINEAIAAVVALDIPSGAECDSGRMAVGCVRADFTVAFDSLKPIHVHEAGKEACGHVEAVQIGIPEQAHADVEAAHPPEPAPSDEPPKLTLVSPAPASFQASQPVQPQATTHVPPGQAVPVPSVSIPAGENTVRIEQVFAHLPPRGAASHKGTYGSLVAVCGSAQYRGAAALATLGALRSGVGLCCLASTEAVCASVASSIHEATFLPLTQNWEGGIAASAAAQLTKRVEQAGAVLIGCGMGNTPDTAALLDAALLQCACPLIVDADGINALAGNIMKVKNAKPPVILTPHPGEMARLAGTTVEQVEQDREGTAARMAQESGAVVVLKGAGTVIASPQGALLVNPTGNPGLARGGSGDILAGMISSFAAQGIEPYWAAVCGVYLHGLAADRTARRLSQYAMLPHELLADLCQIFLEQGR